MPEGSHFSQDTENSNISLSRKDAYKAHSLREEEKDSLSQSVKDACKAHFSRQEGKDTLTQSGKDAHKAYCLREERICTRPPSERMHSTFESQRVRVPKGPARSHRVPTSSKRPLTTQSQTSPSPYNYQLQQAAQRSGKSSPHSSLALLDP